MKDRIYLSPPDLRGNEQTLMQSVFKSNWIAPVGPMLQNFEEKLTKYVGIENGVALNSATAALHLGLKVMGVKKGDKVLCSTFTFVASANPIHYLGADPIFVDAELGTWNICPALLEKAIKIEIEKGLKPKVLILVHGYGRSAKVDEILSITKKYDIKVLEDAASALGAKYKNKFCGTLANMGVFSFNGNKIITTSGGGMLVSNQKDKVDRALHLSRQAKEGSGSYQYQEIGYNYRLSNVLAAIGVAQMELLPQFIENRKWVFEYYKEYFKDLEVLFLESEKNSEPNYWLTAVLFKNTLVRDEVRKVLEQENIESRLLWKPLHQQEIYSNAVAYVNGVSDDLYKRGLCLPSGSSLSKSDLVRICTVVKNIIQ